MSRLHNTGISASAQKIKWILCSGDEELPSPASVWFINPSGDQSMAQEPLQSRQCPLSFNFLRNISISSLEGL